MKTGILLVFLSCTYTIHIARSLSLRRAMPLSYLYVYDLCFQHLSPLGRRCECKGTKDFHSCKRPEKFFFYDPLAPTSAGAPQERTPSRLCECKGTTFLIPRKPCPDNSSKKSHTALTVSPKEIHSSTNLPYPRQEQRPRSHQTSHYYRY